MSHSHGAAKPTLGRTILDWMYTTDAKKIGVLYILFAFLFFFVGGALAGLMRVQLSAPNNTFVDGNTFNGLVTMHGTVMIFLFAMPMLAGAINFVMPLQIGARDMAFPRLNSMSLWLFIFGGIVLSSSYVLGMPTAGWTGYAPLSTMDHNEIGMDLWIIGLQILGVSSILTGLNFIVTILRFRAPGMTLFKMPLFVWSALVTGWLLILAMPPLTVALTGLLFERHFGGIFFDANKGGDPLLYQHLFWFFGHPEVYILVLPAFGMISEVIPVFSRKPVFGYKPMAWSMIAIAFLGFIVWAHHMFSSGLDPLITLAFMILTMLIGVPTGIKIFNWLATMWRGKLHFHTPMMFVAGFLFTFVIGGFSGIMLAVVPVDLQVTHSYFIVAHFHYVIVGGTLLGVFAGVYFWFPKVTGRMLSETLGHWHFWITVVGANLTFFPMHWQGLMGMPRRVATYDPAFTDTNFWVGIGGLIMGLGQLILVANFIYSWIKNRRAGDNPWNAKSLEWTVSSPPPADNFEVIPTYTGVPYDYGVPVPKKKRAGQAAVKGES